MTKRILTQKPVVVAIALLVGLLHFVTETMQLFGVPIFGQTFDPLDYLIFAIGIGAAVLFESTVLSRLPGQTTP